MSSSESEPSIFEESGSDYKPDTNSDTETDNECFSSGVVLPRTTTTCNNKFADMELQLSLPSQASSDEVTLKTRKRLRNEETWKRNIKKKSRLSGQPYNNYKGHSVPGKKFSELDCSCSKKCHTLLSLEKRRFFFEIFYKLPTYDLQTTYLDLQVVVKDKSRMYTKNETHKRLKTRVYLAMGDDGKEIKICKEFLSSFIVFLTDE